VRRLDSTILGILAMGALFVFAFLTGIMQGRILPLTICLLLAGFAVLAIAAVRAGPARRLVFRAFGQPCGSASM